MLPMHPKKICVIHLNQIGDLAFSMPLLKALRENFPDARIHSVVKPYLKELLVDSPHVDTILVRDSSWRGRLGLIRRLWRESYDLTVCLPRSEESLLMALCTRAKIKAGFSTFLNNRVLHIRETVDGHPCWHNNLKLLKKLDLTVPQNDYLGFFPTDEDIRTFNLPAEYVVISPGASRRRLIKAWPWENYARLMVYLWQTHALTPVLVGDKSNSEVNAQIIELAGSLDATGRLAPVDLAGRSGLRSLCAVLKRARLFVGIDSGVMHLAASVDIPVVGLFGPTDPYYVGPLNKNHRVVRREDMDCIPCYLKGCRHLDCMQKLPFEKVRSACDALLNRSP